MTTKHELDVKITAPVTYCYAQYEEGPYQSCVGDVICDLLSDHRAGETVTIYRGIKTLKRHENFISFNADDVIEQMHESAFEECGEVADDYLPPFAPRWAESLENHLNKAAAVWFNAHVPQPTFWLVENLEEIEVTL